jgi:hypothetical protein
MSLSFLSSGNIQTYTVTSPYGRRMEFKFSYVYTGSSWRAYILSSPSYGSRSADLHSTHRYSDSSCNRHYVCWTVNLLRLEDMIEVSRLWARKTARYIDCGESF